MDLRTNLRIKKFKEKERAKRSKARSQEPADLPAARLRKKKLSAAKKKRPGFGSSCSSVSDHLNEVVFGGHKLTMKEKRDLRWKEEAKEKARRRNRKKVSANTGRGQRLGKSEAPGRLMAMPEPTPTQRERCSPTEPHRPVFPSQSSGHRLGGSRTRGSVTKTSTKRDQKDLRSKRAAYFEKLQKQQEEKMREEDVDVKRKEQEAAAKRKEQEAAAKRKEQEAAARRKEQEAAARRKEQEVAARRKEQEVAAKRREEESAVEKEREKRSPVPSQGEPAAEAIPSDVIEQYLSEKQLRRLTRKWQGLEFVLRPCIDSERAATRVYETSQKSVLYLDELEKKASECNMLKGQLSRLLLPYDENTAVDSQEAHDGEGSPLDDIMDSTTRVRMTKDASALRGLVRVKIADDADLDQARSAVEEILGFFDKLSKYASRAGVGNYALLRHLQSAS